MPQRFPGARALSGLDAMRLPRVTLGPRALDDYEMLSSGGFAPLTGFMREADYHSCLETMRLSNGRLFPIPITLPVEHPVEPGSRVAIVHPRGVCQRSLISGFTQGTIKGGTSEWEVRRPAMTRPERPATRRPFRWTSSPTAAPTSTPSAKWIESQVCARRRRDSNARPGLDRDGCRVRYTVSGVRDAMGEDELTPRLAGSEKRKLMGRR